MWSKHFSRGWQREMYTFSYVARISKVYEIRHKNFCTICNPYSIYLQFVFSFKIAFATDLLE